MGHETELAISFSDSHQKIRAGRVVQATLALVLCLLMVVPSVQVMLDNEGSDASTVSASSVPLVLKPGQRKGEYNLDDNPSEFLANGEAGSAWFGATMNKLDFNGDGITDLAISAPGRAGGRVYIFDGSYQLKYPNLQVKESQARWTFTGSNNFGTDFDVGDVNGDKVNDILIINNYYSMPQAFLYYGGSYVNKVSTFSSPNVTLDLSRTVDGGYYYGYYGGWAGLGDTDGDGYDDIWCGYGGYWYRVTYPPGLSYWYYYYYGDAIMWYGGPTKMSGMKTYYDANLRIKPSFTWQYDYSSSGYGYDYHYDFLGAGGVSLGDMNGDGREEIAFGCPMKYMDQNSYYYGAVMVMYPRSNIRSVIDLTAMQSSSYVDWVGYSGANVYNCVGFDPLIYDYNGDGLGDLTFCTGFLSTSYQDNGKWTWMIDGSTTIPTGWKSLASSTSYSRRFYSKESTIFGSHAFGDYDGDGLADLALGSGTPGKVYILLNNQFVGKTGTIEVSAISVFTVVAPSGAQKFAYPGDYYRYYYYGYYAKFRPICFWNRDNDGLDDLFIGDIYATINGLSQCGAVYGISNYPMFGIGRFDATEGDQPNHKTLYAEHRSYGFRGSAWNRWNIYGTTMTWEFMVGNYHAVVRYTNPDMTQDGAKLEVLEDYWGILRVDLGSVKLTPDEAKNTLYVDFKVLFTMKLPVEGDLDVRFTASAAHIQYTQLIKEVGKVRNRFKFIGDLEVSTVPGTGDGRTVRNGDWLPEDMNLRFTGMRLVYNGTEDFPSTEDMAPFYPRDEFFQMEMVNTLGEMVVDNSSSGRDFVMEMNAGDMPIEMTFNIRQVGIPEDRMVNSITPFKVRVDTDTPTAPPGIIVHADGFDDMNTITDNDNELYITWSNPGEFNSGIGYYLVYCTGSDGFIEADANFAKVVTESVGEVEVTVKAVDRVGHVGPVGTGRIYIDSELMTFGGFSPGSDEWMNTLTPTVSVRIEDIGGRAIVGSSVEYSVSGDGGETWGEWQGAGSVLDSKVLDVRTSPMLAEGSENVVRFRARDEAGNVMESGGYPVNVDVSGPGFEGVEVDGLEGWEGEWMDGPTVDLSLKVVDPYSGVDGPSVEYRMTVRGRADLESVPWSDLGLVEGGVEVAVGLDGLELSSGDTNYVQFRARDVVGNGYTYSEAYNIWVNTLPEPVITLPEDGKEVLEGEVVEFDGSGTVDVDGDVLTYVWKDEVTFEGATETKELGSGQADQVRFEEMLGPGVHVIRLVVDDGLHEVFSEAVTVVVEERIVPVWLSMEDSDEDGMPNYWEYAYHLPWDGSVNGDGMYVPSEHSGVSREQLYRLLRPRYANGTAVVTGSNDNDGDGHTDFEEYLGGYDPTNAMDFPVYEMTGEEESDVQDLFIIGLVIALVIFLAVMLVLVLMNAGMVRTKLKDEQVRQAQQETKVMEDRMLAGGRDRLAALKSASEGRPVSLPAAAPMGAALPAGPTEAPAPVQQEAAMPMAAQPMDAQPMVSNYQGPGGQ